MIKGTTPRSAAAGMTGRFRGRSAEGEGCGEGWPGTVVNRSEPRRRVHESVACVNV